MKKDHNLTNKNIHSHNNSGKLLPYNFYTSRQQPPYQNKYRGRYRDQKNSQIFSKRYIVDQTVKTINMERFIQDQTQTEIITPITIEFIISYHFIIYNIQDLFKIKLKQK